MVDQQGNTKRGGKENLMDAGWRIWLLAWFPVVFAVATYRTWEKPSQFFWHSWAIEFVTLSLLIPAVVVAIAVVIQSAFRLAESRHRGLAAYVMAMCIAVGSLVWAKWPGREDEYRYVPDMSTLMPIIEKQANGRQLDLFEELDLLQYESSLSEDTRQRLEATHKQKNQK